MFSWFVIPALPLQSTGFRDPHHLQHGHVIQGIKGLLQRTRLLTKWLNNKNTDKLENVSVYVI